MNTHDKINILNAKSLQKIRACSQEFNQNLPFPHIVIDNFLSDEYAESLSKAFENPDLKNWTKYIHFNEKKYGLNNKKKYSNDLNEVINYLYSPEFCKELSFHTGVTQLLPDHILTGAGLHLTPSGGFLNIHQDFERHPLFPHLQREVNLIIYLSKDYLPIYKGELEFWDKEMKNCAVSIAPIFNRAVIFLTGKDCFHGHPQVLNAPEKFTRNSLALYYYTDKGQKKLFKTTKYLARPVDLHLKWLFVLENIALRIAEPLRRTYFKLKTKQE